MPAIVDAAMAKTAEDVKQRIVDYYVATTEASYLASWGGESLALHCGIADESTASLNESLDNTNAFLAERAGIGPGTRVLDAGCGVGGSSIWLAQKLKARVTGITIVERQVELVDFAAEDMLATSFPDASFDVVWNLESMCHVAALDDYLSEAQRLLRDGGRLVVIDLCRGSSPNESLEDCVCSGWALASLRSPAEVVTALEARRFQRIETKDLGSLLERSNQALEAYASRSLLMLRAEQAFAGAAPEPHYAAHVRAALAFVQGMRDQAFSTTFFACRRPGR
jgi:tocopherol O-methyltransferase